MQLLRISSFVLLAMGAVFLAISVFRSPEAAMKNAWTEEDAQQKSQAGLELNQVAHLMEHANSPTQRKILEEKLEAAQARYDGIAARFKAIQAGHERICALLKWSGLLLILIGAGFYWGGKE